MKNSRFSAVLERIRQCPGNEHQQGYLRLFLVSIISLYVYILAVHPQVTFEVRDKDTVKQIILVVYPIFFTYALLFFYWLYKHPVKVPARRIVSNFIDFLSLSIVVHLSDEWGGVIYSIYPWILIGSAFRFGLVYLLIGTVFSVLMFAVVVVTTPFWLEHLTVSIGLLLGLFILPLYLAFLLEQKSKALREAEVANFVSHDLRTPLQSIIGLSDLSLEAAHRDNVPDYMRRINGAARHLLSLINDFLDFSSSRSNRLILSKHPFEIHRMVAEVEAMVLPQDENKRLVFKVEIGRDVPDKMIGDDLRIKQVLVNLISNAVKYTDAGEIVFAIRVLELNDDLVRLQFSVRDTGIGIRADDIEKMFQSFVQVHGDAKPHGSGLGLAISQQLVRLMDSEITVTSELGKGSRFAFDLELPLAFEDSEATGGRDSKMADRDREIVGRDGELRILVAEDEPLLRYVHEQTFGTTGRYRLTVVDDGEAALGLLLERRYDLAILDHQMPLLTGLELAKAWRREEKKRRVSRMPIILLTADTTVIDLDGGRSDVLVRYKPIIPADLIRDVEHLLARC